MDWLRRHICRIPASQLLNSHLSTIASSGLLADRESVCVESAYPCSKPSKINCSRTFKIMSSAAAETGAAFAQRTLPASWYHSTQLYEAERRAIFSQKWLQITHENRFANPGDFASYDMAGYPFFIIKDRSGGLRAFHNVCRHRGFPVVREKSGKCKKILSCGYHGKFYLLLIDSPLLFIISLPI